MIKYFTIVSFVVLLSACSGLDIKSLSLDAANNAHKKSSELDGYIVYQPMIVVEIGEKEVCTKKDSKGKCMEKKLICAASDPKYLPDYSRPYLVTPKSGFGKAGIDVKIENGWMLGGIKDSSDNSGILTAITAAAGFGLVGDEGAGKGNGISGGCTKQGLYSLKIENGLLKTTPILMYP